MKQGRSESYLKCSVRNRTNEEAMLKLGNEDKGKTLGELNKL